MEKMRHIFNSLVPASKWSQTLTYNYTCNYLTPPLGILDQTLNFLFPKPNQDNLKMSL